MLTEYRYNCQRCSVAVLKPDCTAYLHDTDSSTIVFGTLFETDCKHARQSGTAHDHAKGTYSNPSLEPSRCKPIAWAVRNDAPSWDQHSVRRRSWISTKYMALCIWNQERSPGNKLVLLTSKRLTTSSRLSDWTAVAIRMLRRAGRTGSDLLAKILLQDAWELTTPIHP